MIDHEANDDKVSQSKVSYLELSDTILIPLFLHFYSYMLITIYCRRHLYSLRPGSTVWEKGKKVSEGRRGKIGERSRPTDSLGNLKGATTCPVN